MIGRFLSVIGVRNLSVDREPATLLLEQRGTSDIPERPERPTEHAKNAHGFHGNPIGWRCPAWSGL
jgi:hypothetical protein